MRTPYCVVMITVEDKQAAEKLQRALVEKKLAACVSAIPGVSSLYRWEGKIEQGTETLLICKSRSGLALDLAEFVKKNHPAAVPEIISLPIESGNKAYLDWLGANTMFAKPPGGFPPVTGKD